MRRFSTLLFLLFFCVVPAVYGDTLPPSFNCARPLKQTTFATQLDLDRYKMAVDRYRSCLEAFVKEQEKAIEIHRRAAQSAIDDWNQFAGQETKGPPKSPEDKGGDVEFRGEP